MGRCERNARVTAQLSLPFFQGMPCVSQCPEDDILTLLIIKKYLKKASAAEGNQRVSYTLLCL